MNMLVALSAAIAVAGVGLWSIEARMAAGHPDCPGLGSPRAVPAVQGDAGASWSHRTLDDLMDQMGCKPSVRVVLRNS